MEDLRKKGRGRGLDRVKMDPNLPGPLNDLLYDPLTSGELLISFPSDPAQNLVETLKKEAQLDASVIGQGVEGPPGEIQII